MLKNQLIWLAEQILGLKLKNMTVKRPEMTESICCFHMQQMVRSNPYKRQT